MPVAGGQPYETYLRVPMMIRMTARDICWQHRQQVGSGSRTAHIDVAPTIAQLASWYPSRPMLLLFAYVIALWMQMDAAINNQTLPCTLFVDACFISAIMS